jgi:TolA-binding protein
MSTLGALVLLGWLWPFSGGDDDDGTIRKLEAQTVEIDRETEIENSNERARRNYELFLEVVSDDPRLSAEAMRRLADLELEASEAAELGENMQSVMLSSYDGAVDLYEQLLARYPDYARNDLVLYQLARAYESAGRGDEALAVLDRLVTTYPDTVHYDEAQFRRGEMLFIQRRYADAERAYAVLAAAPSNDFYLQSLYKLGWSRFKLAEHDASLVPFFALLDLRLAGDTADGELEFTADTRRAERELVEDTLRVLSITFSYLDGASSIDAFFDARGEPAYAHVVYGRLGDLYVAKGRYEDASTAYLAFVARQPNHPRAPRMEMRVVDAFRDGGFPTQVLVAKERFVGHYGMDSAYWTVNDPAAAPEVIAFLKTNLTDLAQFYHARAQNPEPPAASLTAEAREAQLLAAANADYRAAAHWYRKYLDFFPNEPDSAGTNFLLAEILFESEQYAAATDEYERTAYDYPLHEQSAEAAYAALLAYKAHEETLDAAAAAPWHARFLDSSLRFAATYPSHPQVATVLTATAEDLFDQGKFSLAIDVAGNVTAMEPPPPQGLLETAWTVTAHSHFDLAQFPEAEQAYYRLAAVVMPEDVAKRDEIDRRIASSIYKQGEAARGAGDLEGAIGHFLRVGAAVPNSDIRETAEYDAAAALITLGAWSRATGVLEAFRARYPDSELGDQVTRSLAAGYLETGELALAASEFSAIADDAAAGDEERQEALWKAAELYQEAGELAEEKRTLAALVERYPETYDDTLEARLRLADIAMAEGDTAARARWLQDIIDTDAGAGAARTDRSRFLAASATLELAEPSRAAFTGFRLTIPLKESLATKRTMMEQALAAYGRAADYNVAGVTTAATYRIAEIYYVFSSDLMDSERPADLDADALEQYDILLEEQAFPFEEQAIELFEVNASRAADNVYDEWVRRSFEALAELQPARYAKAERSEDASALLN